MGWKIFGLFVSVGLILGGLSGGMVLRGTDSSTALIVVGCIFLISDLVSIVNHKKETEAARLAAEQLATAERDFATTVLQDPDPATLDAEFRYPVVLQPTGMFSYGNFQIYMNGGRVGEISADNKEIAVATRRMKNVLCAVNNGTGATTYAFFEVTAAVPEPRGFLVDSASGVILNTGEKKNGIAILRAEA